MINIGTIGTSFKTEEFLRAARLTNKFRLIGVYSSSINSGKDFATIYKADYYSDELNNLFFDPEIDLIYIGSRPHLHFKQAKRALKAGKHVLIDQPHILSVDEWNELFFLAEEMDVFLFEAAYHIHGKNYQRVKQFYLKKIKEASQPYCGANFSLTEYEDNYLRYLNNVSRHREVPADFDLKQGGGALMTLGIYPVYIAMDLFGTPNSVRYLAKYGKNGVDLFGHIYLNYHSFTVTIFISKAVHSTLFSEIYIDDETIVFHDLKSIERVDFTNANNEKLHLVDYQPESHYYDQLIHIAQLLSNPEDRHFQLLYEDWKQLSIQVCRTMELLRKSANLEIL